MSNRRDSSDPLLATTTQDLDNQDDTEDWKPSLPGGNMGMSYSTAKYAATASFL